MARRPHLPLLSAYPFGDGHGLTREIAEIRAMTIRSAAKRSHSYSSSVRRGYLIKLFERKGILERFMARHWPFGTSPSGETRREYYITLMRESKAR